MGTASDKPRNICNIKETSPFSQVSENKIKLEPGNSVSSHVSEARVVQSGIKNESGAKEILNNLLLRAAVAGPSGCGDPGRMISKKTPSMDQVEKHVPINETECAPKSNLDSNTNEDIGAEDGFDIQQGDSQMPKDADETDSEIEFSKIISKIISFKKQLDADLKSEKPENTSSDDLDVNKIPTTSRHDYNTRKSDLESSPKDPRHFSTGNSKVSDEDDTCKIDLPTPEFSSRYSFADPAILNCDPPFALIDQREVPLDGLFELVLDEISTESNVAVPNPKLDTCTDSELKDKSFKIAHEEVPGNVSETRKLNPSTESGTTPNEVKESSLKTADEYIPGNVPGTSKLDPSTESGTTLEEARSSFFKMVDENVDPDNYVSETPLTSGEEQSKGILHNESDESLNSGKLTSTAASSKSTLPETCIHASEFNLSPTKRSPNLDTTPENHYYNNQVVDPNSFEEVYSTQTAEVEEFYEEHHLDSFWNVNAEARSNKGNEMATFKQQLVDLQISLNKARIGVDFKLKTIITDLRTDFEYWSALVSGALDAVQTISSVEERREMASPVFSDVSYEDQWPVTDGDKGSSSGAPPPTKLQDGTTQNLEHPNGGPLYAVPMPTPAYNYGLTGPGGYNRMTLPNRMYYPAYHGYAPRAKYQAPHQPAYMFGHNMRPPVHHQYPSPSHGRMHFAQRGSNPHMPPPKTNSMPNSSHSGGAPFFQNRSGNGETSNQTPAMAAPPSYYSSGGGTPFPQNRSNSRPRPSSSSQSTPPASSSASYCGGPPFPKRSHAVPLPSRPPGNAAIQKTNGSSKDTDEDATSSKPKFAAKEKPKKKSNNRKRSTSKPHQGKILP